MQQINEATYHLLLTTYYLLLTTYYLLLTTDYLLLTTYHLLLSRPSMQQINEGDPVSLNMVEGTAYP